MPRFKCNPYDTYSHVGNTILYTYNTHLTVFICVCVCVHTYEYTRHKPLIYSSPPEATSASFTTPSVHWTRERTFVVSDSRPSNVCVCVYVCCEHYRPTKWRAHHLVKTPEPKINTRNYVSSDVILCGTSMYHSWTRNTRQNTWFFRMIIWEKHNYCDLT